MKSEDYPAVYFFFGELNDYFFINAINVIQVKFNTVQNSKNMNKAPEDVAEFFYPVEDLVSEEGKFSV